MKFLITISLFLSAISATVIAPRQPTDAAHIIAPIGHNGTDNPRTLLLSTPKDSIPLALASSNNDHSAIPAKANIQSPSTPTTHKVATVTQVTRPHDPEPILILPFHFQVVENCLADNSIAARGVYANRDYIWAFNIPPGATIAVEHGVGGYPRSFLVGPFEYASSRLHFSYANAQWGCEWSDEETWKECGECRSGLWTADVLDCGTVGGRKSRSKEMDCSFIMGWRSQLTSTPI